MGLDIYAGTMTRYYAHNWKTAVQQWAEENGYSFQRVTPDGTAVQQWAEENGYSFQRVTPDGEPVAEEELSPEEIQEIIENWRDQILSAISPSEEKVFVPWKEDNEKPYYTDKPDWDAFGAMLLVAACLTYKNKIPPTVEKDWNFMENKN